jgi:uncharacterized protein YgbK (DUF1537 family)
MIVVIADDFTGAAELGGVALRNGFRAVIDTEVGEVYPDVDVVVLATDTRSMSGEAAGKATRELVTKVVKLQPSLIYKKIDSVLRGNILEELTVHMSVLGLDKALLVPANPSLQRIIKSGTYYYQGLPLAESDFAASNPSSVGSSSVLDMLGDSLELSVSVVAKEEDFLEKGVFVANTEYETDLTYWASKTDDRTVVAGASGFFNAILQQVNLNSHLLSDQRVVSLGSRVLYICGSAFPASREAVELAFESGREVAYMPKNILSENRNQLVEEWKDAIIKGLDVSGSVIVAINEVENNDGYNLSVELGNLISEVTGLVLRRTIVNELVIEGGATASAVLRAFEHSQLYPVQELATGVIRMKVATGDRELHVTMKPGSYAWPPSIWPYPVNA